MKLAPLTPNPTPTLPLKGRETTDAPCSSPFKGEAGRGMGNVFHVNLIKNGLIWLVLCLVGGGSILFIAQQWRIQVEQDDQQTQIRLTAVTAQLAEAHRGMAHHWADRYREFVDKGMVGEERRIDWIERVTRVGSSVIGFRYEIAPQRQLAGAGGFNIMASRMTLWMNVPHEGRLLDILRNIGQEPSALVHLQGCVIERIEERRHGLTVKCEMDWMTLRSAIKPP
ncbi:MAG: hypothetical protein Q8O31_00190 [Rhodocyclaceae bacterium]|nr:hypothetical protein [Rhodocyclaceae bacterium]